MYLPLKSGFLLLMYALSSAVWANDDSHAWLDDFHGNITDSLFNSTEWFDEFFDEGEERVETSQASAKIRLGWEPREGHLGRYKSRVRIRAKLPALSKKVDLIFDDYDEAQQEGITDEVINETRNQDEDFNVALRWVHKTKDNKYFSTRLGLASEPDIYVKALYRQIFETSENTNIMLQPSIYYYLDQGHAERFSANFEYNNSTQDMFQLTNSWGYIEDEDEVKWRHSLLHFHQLNHKQAFISGIFANGVTHGNYKVENSGVFFRYRWQSVRKWLYFEIEPFVHWPDDRDYNQTFGIAFRVEGKFKK